MEKQNTPTSINSYKRRWNFNIGIILFGVIFIYLIATIIIYITNHDVSIYEVRQGSIIRDNAFTGFVVRDEVAVPAEDSGYLNYYVSDKEKVSLDAKVYALSTNKLTFEQEESEVFSTISTETQQNIRKITQAFIEQFDGNQFDNTYVFKSDLLTELDNGKRESRIEHLNALLENEENIAVRNTLQEGIVVYSADGYEPVNIEDVTLDHIYRKDYEPIQIYNNTKITAGDIAYRLVLDEEWSVLISLEEDDIEELKELTQINVRFAKDNQTMWADFSIIDKGNDGVFGCLKFNKSMIRYVTERYLNIELMLENQSGLKIPKSAITTKDFFVIPESYLTVGGNSRSTGIMIQNENAEYTFKSVTIYYRDEEDLVYLDMAEFDEGATIMRADSINETMQLRETRALQGVYNINKGYAVFKQIHILSESEEYYIIAEGNKYSLSNYDHISLTSDSIKENDIVF